MATPKTIRQRIAYFHDLRNEGFNSHETVAIAKEEAELSKGDKAAWQAFYAVYPDHEFRDIESAS